jgi:hypothetical protein
MALVPLQHAIGWESLLGGAAGGLVREQGDTPLTGIDEENIPTDGLGYQYPGRVLATPMQQV